MKIKNYKINIANKIRIIPKVSLIHSKTGNGYTLSNSEFERVSIFVAKEICTSKDLITISELAFLMDIFEITKTELSEQTKIHLSIIKKWENLEKENGDIGELENFIIKEFFNKKLHNIK